MTSLAYIEPELSERDDHAPVPPRRIGEVLVAHGYTTPADLSKALALQQHSDASLGEILIAQHSVTAINLHRALGIQANLNFTEAPYVAGGGATQFPFHYKEMLDNNFVPIASDSSDIKIAIFNPGDVGAISDLCDQRGVTPHFVLSSKEKIHLRIAEIGKDHFSKLAEYACPDDYSCRVHLGRKNNLWFSIAALMATGALIYLGWLETLLFIIALTVFAGNGILKLTCLMAFLFKKPPQKKPLKVNKKLEKVSILVPVFRETYIVERLIKRLSQLDYPKELLEIYLICEEEDKSTQIRITNASKPDHIRMLVAPKGEIQTKPRAMNYALNFCKGAIVGIYDAEDAPEYDQVYKAVRHLQSTPDNVVCVQARLDFFNQNTNWLARCFTIEYAMLFRVILQGLQRLDLPIPLGGTSMYIRTDALKKWGQWDAHNVTEDADLGMRLYRKGLRVECLDSTTYEEANYKFRSWVKQRSRWLKGFVMTWSTHIRTPVQTYREMGFFAFLAFNVLMLGTVVTYLVIPLLLPYWLLSIGIIPPIIGTMPYGVLPFMVAVLALGEPLLIIVGYYATQTDKHRPLRPTLFTLFAYWPLASLAAYKAAFEVITAPAYWDKTEHGLNDDNYGAEIDELTLPEWRKAG
jgi:cellulose synthase/poly-beta-1,6-N-acetylglucosamine synthase-like glycosyltransferase